MIDDVLQRVDALLDGEVKLVVDGVDGVGDDARGLEVRGVLETNAERVQSRPPCGTLAVVFHAGGAHAGRD